MAPLAELGNVPAGYRHEWRVAAPAAPLVLPGAVFTWSHLCRVGETIPADLDAEARETIAAALASEDWDPSYGLNIALLHRCTTPAYLIAGVWRGHQELWERAYAKELGGSEPFCRVPPTGGDTPAACVWELGVICHERMTWHRSLFSARDDAAKHTRLADGYAGRE